MNHKPILLQSHYLPRQAATAAFTPPRSSGKEGAERWEFLPPCSEARNQLFIPALRLLTSARRWGWAPAESGPHLLGPGPCRPQSPRRPSPGGKAVATEGRVRTGVGEGGWPGSGLDVVEAGSQGQLWRRETGSGQKVGPGWSQQTHAGKPPRRPLQGCRRARWGLAVDEGRENWEAARQWPWGRPVSTTHTLTCLPPILQSKQG